MLTRRYIQIYSVFMSSSSLCSLNVVRRGITTRRFVGHTKDVLSVAFSADNRQIVSGSRDKTIKLWNTLGVCKYTIQVRAGFGGNERVLAVIALVLF